MNTNQNAFSWWRPLALLFLILVPGTVLTAQETRPVGPVPSTAAPSLDAAAILARLDSHEGYTSAHATGLIRIEDRRGIKESTFESWSLGTERSLIAFTGGEEAGQKILRLPDALYLAYPEADKPIKIQGAALRDSVAGSDFSYEDMAGDQTYGSRYRSVILRREMLGTTATTVLELEALRPGLAYPVLRVWVRENDFSGVRVEKFSQNRRLLKTEEVQTWITVGSRLIPSRMVMVDHQRSRSSTTFEIRTLEVDLAIPASKFSLQELTW